jgi:uncharacterized membrane protein YphA (DoxX/SURF4 family)
MDAIVSFGFILTEMALALTLVAAGAAKLAKPNDFANTLVGLGLPARHVRIVSVLAFAIPLIELMLGISTTIRIAPKITSLLVVAITIMFVVVTVWASRRRSHVPCRCFGALTESHFGNAGIVRTVILLVMACGAAWYEWQVELDVPISPSTAVLLVVAYGGFAIAARQAAIVQSQLASHREAVT